METSELKLECLKLVTGEPDVTLHIAKADMLYQYCINDKLPCRSKITASELTSIVYRSIKDSREDGNDTTDCCN